LIFQQIERTREGFFENGHFLAENVGKHINSEMWVQTRLEKFSKKERRGIYNL
jgi:hypothetical protein|tara:strand:+ start:335 stop:493 length:159 start_codon:yes stop_codon:yes gene_type:complete